MRLLIATVLMVLGASVASATCTTSTPVNLYGQNGGNGIVRNDGVPGGFTSGGIVGQIAQGGGMGTADLGGTANCPTFDDSKVNAGVAAAMAMASPLYLSDSEKFALTANLGYFEDETAGAITGIARIDKNISVNAGFAYAPDEDVWGARGGIRVGW